MGSGGGGVRVRVRVRLGEPSKQTGTIHVDKADYLDTLPPPFTSVCASFGYHSPKTHKLAHQSARGRDMDSNTTVETCYVCLYTAYFFIFILYI